jgi:hypothetical protein
MSAKLGQIVHYNTQGEPKDDPVVLAAIVTGTYTTPPDAVDLTVFHPGGPESYITKAREGTEPGEWSDTEEA